MAAVKIVCISPKKTNLNKEGVLKLLSLVTTHEINKTLKKNVLGEGRTQVSQILNIVVPKPVRNLCSTMLHTNAG